MLHGTLQKPESYTALLSNKAWATAFDWLSKLPQNPQAGIYDIQGNDIYANVHGYETQPRANCRFEAHRKYVDLQFCINGSELIEFQETDDLKAITDYDEKKDVQFYSDQRAHSVVHIKPGSFATFHPNEAHMPKLTDELSKEIFKLVIKIRLELLLQQ